MTVLERKNHLHTLIVETNNEMITANVRIFKK